MDINYRQFNPELWGGIECTINRVEDNFRDQLILSGHYNRPDDIEKIASLGIKKLRYPVLWERHEPEEGQTIDWRLSESKLGSIRNNNIEPIVGLLHHGSGPVFTDLTDPDFAFKFSQYAGRVAKKFPWINFYCPVNEPLTTARFSGLYGFWYPHCRDERLFLKMLLNQVMGVLLAMQEIKKVNADAQFIQTEDLSKIHSTATLKYQADFENERRWLTNDLLCGMVNNNHPLWDYLTGHGITEAQLNFFLENSRPPDTLGFNYYATSERFLTEEIEKFTQYSPGRNGIHRYVDVEATRSGHNLGLKSLLMEAWNRYKLPVAVTECHMNCTREEQMRWFNECWQSARELIHDGVMIKAVTAWSLIGSHDWNSLLTRNVNDYESGVFDITDKKIRKTALFNMIRQLGETGVYNHPLLPYKGWWHADRRNFESRCASERTLIIIEQSFTSHTVRLLTESCQLRGIPFLAIKVDSPNFYDYEIQSIKEKYRPWAIITIELFHEFQPKLSSIYACIENQNSLVADRLEKLRHSTDILRISVNKDAELNALTIRERNAENVKEHCNKAIDLLIDKAYGQWMISKNPFNSQIDIAGIGGQKDIAAENNIPLISFNHQLINL